MTPAARPRPTGVGRRGGISNDTIRKLVRLLLAGLAAGFFLRAGWPMPVGPTLLLGFIVSVWAIGSFLIERPER